MIVSNETLPFNHDWEFRSETGTEWAPVHLPHDAMILEGRQADAPSGPAQAHFLGGSYIYRKRWQFPEKWSSKRIFLYFEGVYRTCRVIVNGQEAGKNLWGLFDFEVQIDAHLLKGQENVIEVRVEHKNLPSARWYTGSGIIKPVWIVARDAISLRRDGIFFKTISTAQPAKAEVSLEIDNPTSEDVDVSFTLLHEKRDVAHATGHTKESTLSVTLDITAPLLWSHEQPHLYQLVVKIGNEEHTTMVGLRTLGWSAQQGFMVNGKSILLQGACIHHDSGVLGGVTLPEFEMWRVKALKENGFNAIRSCHSPAPEALLHACDVHGLYLMDEYHDYWYERKARQDDGPLFAERWHSEVDSMVRKARNHPSVVMYSIGNEVSEPRTVYGMEIARRIIERVCQSDSTRPITGGINLMGAAIGWPWTRTGNTTDQPPSGAGWNIDSTMINSIYTLIAWVFQNLPRLWRTDHVTKDLFAMMDIAGYNYGEVRFGTDVKLHPNRIILGTETLPDDIAWNWIPVRANPSIIGVFMWTGWDYLGEAGAGDWLYDTRRGGYQKPYPHLTAGTGAVDIIGVPGFTAFLAQAAWGLLPAPVATVRPPHLVGKSVMRSPWRKSDAVNSWSWKGCAGKPAEIQIISADEEVEVLLNGRSLGRRPAGSRHGNVTHFKSIYQPGELIVIGYKGGKESSRSALRSAGETSLRLAPETRNIRADGMDLGFIRIQLCDEKGTVEMLDDDEVTITLEGPAFLAGFGSGARKTTEEFHDNVHSTWQGQALAIIRAGTNPGRITVTANSKLHGSDTLTLEQK